MIRVSEIEQKNLKSSLEELKEYSEIEFTPEHTIMYDGLMKYTDLDNDQYDDEAEKFLVAINDENRVVGVGLCTFRDDDDGDPKADLDKLISVERGAGKAIVEAVIDYSRQMEYRADIWLSVKKDSLEDFYAQFGFAKREGQSNGMIRRKSGEFNPDRKVTALKLLPSTEQEINEKRERNRGIGL